MTLCVCDCATYISGGPSAYGGGCEADDLDAVLHRAPQHYYPDIKERGLAMVWNPTNRKSITDSVDYNM